MKTNTQVHIEHCCHRHGCKYFDERICCPVASGEVAQAYACEACDWELENGALEMAYLMNEMYDKGVAAAMKEVEIW